MLLLINFWGCIYGHHITYPIYPIASIDRTLLLVTLGGMLAAGLTLQSLLHTYEVYPTILYCRPMTVEWGI